MGNSVRSTVFVEFIRDLGGDLEDIFQNPSLHSSHALGHLTRFGIFFSASLMSRA